MDNLNHSKQLLTQDRYIFSGNYICIADNGIGNFNDNRVMTLQVGLKAPQNLFHEAEIAVYVGKYKQIHILGAPSHSDGSNNVRSSMFDRLKPKIGCSNSITIR